METTESAKRATLEQALAKHGARLRASALRMTGNQPDAADLLQDAVESALRRGPAGMSADEWHAWLQVAMRNRFYDACRHEQVVRRLRRSHATVLALTHSAAGHDEPPAWTTIEPEVLRAAISRLGVQFREPMDLWLAGASLREIGQSLRIEPRTIGTRLHRARGRLRVILSEDLAAAA